MSIQHFPNKVRHHKVQHRDQQQRLITLRLMTEHDLRCSLEWLNRSHIVEWWAGEEARPTLADVQERLPSVLAQESITPLRAAEWRADWVMPSRTLLWKRGRMVGRKQIRGAE